MTCAHQGGPGCTWNQNVLGLLRRDSLGLDSGPLGWPLFRCRTARSAPVLLFGRKRGTRKSRLETKTENEASSALLARLWCHLPLQNPANRAENLIRLCSATIGQTGWRMVQFGAIRSRLETPKHRSESASWPIRGGFLSFLSGSSGHQNAPSRCPFHKLELHEIGELPATKMLWSSSM